MHRAQTRMVRTSARAMRAGQARGLLSMGWLARMSTSVRRIRVQRMQSAMTLSDRLCALAPLGKPIMKFKSGMTTKSQSLFFECVAGTLATVFFAATLMSALRICMTVRRSRHVSILQDRTPVYAPAGKNGIP